MGTMVGDDGGANQIGVAPGAHWIGCRNMERGWGTLSSYLECFEWFLAPYPVGGVPAQGNSALAPHVINNSWSCPPDEGCNTANFSIMETAVNNLVAAGIVVVVSAGNSGPSCSTVNTPAAIFENSFSVGATSSSDLIASFSSRGPVTVDGSGRMKPDVAAPGVGVRSATIGTGYSIKSGTSMAGPHVVGAVALLLSAKPEMAGNVGAITGMLKNTALGLTASNGCGGDGPEAIPNNTYGYGRIDALAATASALPVELLDFYARVQNEQVRLYWRTAQESGNSHFEIWRRGTAEASWKLIGKMPGKGYIQQETAYAFIDERPSPGPNYYRLRQVDFDGKESWYGPVSAAFEPVVPMLRLWPAPAHERLYVEWAGSEPPGQWRLSTASGILLPLPPPPGPGHYTAELDVSGLPAGLYFLQVEFAGEVKAARWLKE
ncbi:MAG: S8 family peptidase [Phaeodactylibacter sp.]|nr:S8 family peptidase [Phaeodactylibacter sp.]MCB9273772.1 S8 family peptidase [Lewinellaceae bacterium]